MPDSIASSNIIVAPSYKEMSVQAAERLVQLMASSKNKLLCIASGDTPAGLYKELVRLVENNLLDISSWYFVGLDEWGGMNGDDEGSCRYHLDKQFFLPLNINEERICFFDGKATDLENECRKTERFITDHGGIEVAIVGLGLNGHIGMNEPGTPATLNSHVTAIDAETQKVGQKYFSTPREISSGITLGMANLMQSRQVMLLASGAHKANIVKRIFEEEISERLPATLLRQHPALFTFLDAEAASGIDK